MSDDNNGKFNLSRRKALAGIGAAGGAVGLGGIGTVAQLSDSEERSVTFTAGGLDGTISWSGSYNGDPIGQADFVNMSPGDTTATDHLGNAVPIDIEFHDVKPGDFGCVNFTIEVESNEAWVASKLNVLENIDYENYEPEVEVDPNVTEANTGLEGSGLDPADPTGEAAEQGELAQNIYALPYYDSDGTCTFFDSGSDQFDATAYDGATAEPFWSNSQSDDEFVAQDDGGYEDPDGNKYYLAPRDLLDISQNVNALNTAAWSTSDQSLGFQTAPNGSTIAQGSVMLDGSATSAPTTSNNTQGVSPLSPGVEMNFGYDFHIPFSTGNVIQGDRTSISLDFLFLQSRHTDAPDFTSYSPE